MKILATCALAITVAFAPSSKAQSTGTADVSESPTYEEASRQVYVNLKTSLEELADLREALKEEKLPLARQLSELEAQLSDARQEYQRVSRQLDTRTLDLSNLQAEIKTRKDEATYVSSLLGDYLRNFESRLHVAEFSRYAAPLEAAKLAPESGELSEREVFDVQASLLRISLERVSDALGGARFRATAVDDRSLVQGGTMVLVGPAAIFVADNRKVVGTAEARLGSLEPAAIPYANVEDVNAAISLVANREGYFPLDPTLGNANLIEATQESLVEHLKKGGAVMIPILGMAALALFVAVYKWLALLFTAKPSARKVNDLLDAIAGDDQEAIHDRARRVRGPVGRMLAAGVESLREPQALIEEVMYESVLTTKLKLQRMLPFIQICAASAPLLGLLGTVTGIINTFKLITVFGSGDVKSLSGGISEALITTKFGLIVAIPSLLIHAFLSRKAKGITDQMEKTAIGFINQVMRTRGGRATASAASATEVHGSRPADPVPDPELVRQQVNSILQEMLTADTTAGTGAETVGQGA